MQSVHAIYDGQNVTLLENVAVKTPQKVIVTFLDEPQNGQPAEPLAERFERLFEEWYSETAYHSSGTIIFGHPAYLEIIGMGKPVIPLIFKKIKEKDSFILSALTAITGECPIPTEHHGKFGLIKSDWMAWGKQNGYVQ